MERKVNNVSAEERAALERLSAATLPDSPTQSGMKPAMIRAAFWQALTKGRGSVAGLLDRIVREINDALGNSIGREEFWELMNDIIQVAQIENGYRLTLKTADGQRTIDLMNGQPGKDGAQGPAGPVGPAYELTAADKQAIVSTVLAELNKPKKGEVFKTFQCAYGEPEDWNSDPVLVAGKQYFIEDTPFTAEWAVSGESYAVMPIGTTFTASNGLEYMVSEHGGPGPRFLGMDGNAPNERFVVTIYTAVSGGGTGGGDSGEPVKGELIYTFYDDDPDNGVGPLNSDGVLKAGEGYFFNDTYFVAEQHPDFGYVSPPQGFEFYAESGNKGTVWCDPSWFISWDVAPRHSPINVYAAVGGGNTGDNGGDSGDTGGGDTPEPVKGELYRTFTENELGGFSEAFLEAGKGYFVEDVYFVAQDQGAYVAPPNGTVIDNGRNRGTVGWDGSSWGVYDWDSAPDDTPVNFYKVEGESYDIATPDANKVPAVDWIFYPFGDGYVARTSTIWLDSAQTIHADTYKLYVNGTYKRDYTVTGQLDEDIDISDFIAEYGTSFTLGIVATKAGYTDSDMFTYEIT